MSRLAKARVPRDLKPEIAAIQQMNLEFMSLSYSPQNIRHWRAKVRGPDGTPYENGIFNINIELGEYPHKPPKVRLLTPIYHMNISPKGVICLSITSDRWVPNTRVVDILLEFYDLLSEPSSADALRTDLANMYHTNPAKYKQNARNLTQQQIAQRANNANHDNADMNQAYVNAINNNNIINRPNNADNVNANAANQNNANANDNDDVKQQAERPQVRAPRAHVQETEQDVERKTSNNNADDDDSKQAMLNNEMGGSNRPTGMPRNLSKEASNASAASSIGSLHNLNSLTLSSNPNPDADPLLEADEENVEETIQNVASKINGNDNTE